MGKYDSLTGVSGYNLPSKKSLRSLIQVGNSVSGWNYLKLHLDSGWGFHIDRSNGVKNLENGGWWFWIALKGYAQTYAMHTPVAWLSG